MQNPRIPTHTTTKQGILFLRRMGFPAQKKMNQERRESKSGKVLKKYLDTVGPAAISWCASENDAETLKNLLDVCEIRQEALKNAYETYGIDADTQVKAYLLDAIGKTKSDKETFDI